MNITSQSNYILIKLILKIKKKGPVLLSLFKAISTDIDIQTLAPIDWSFDILPYSNDS